MMRIKNISLAAAKYIWMWVLIFCTGASFAVDFVDLNKIRVVDGERSTSIINQSMPIKKIEKIGGLKHWPWLFIDDNGGINTGNVFINTKTGLINIVSNRRGALSIGHNFILEMKGSNTIQISKGHRVCRFDIRKFGEFDTGNSLLDLLRLGYFYVYPAETYLVTLSKNLDKDSNYEYRTSRIDFSSCKVTLSDKIDQQDYFVELRWTNKGGWWLVGSVEQTLLRSKDGLHWQEVSLPQNTSSLISAYAKTTNEIWIAARINPANAGTGPMLAKSNDGGVTWKEITFQSEEIDDVPYYWLEGRIRIQSGK